MKLRFCILILIIAQVNCDEASGSCKFDQESIQKLYDNAVEFKKSHLNLFAIDRLNQSDDINRHCFLNCALDGTAACRTRYGVGDTSQRLQLEEELSDGYQVESGHFFYSEVKQMGFTDLMYKKVGNSFEFSQLFDENVLFTVAGDNLNKSASKDKVPEKFMKYFEELIRFREESVKFFKTFGKSIQFVYFDYTTNESGEKGYNMQYSDSPSGGRISVFIPANNGRFSCTGQQQDLKITADKIDLHGDIETYPIHRPPPFPNGGIRPKKYDK